MSRVQTGAKGPFVGNEKPIRFKSKKKKVKKSSKATSVGKFEREETKREDGATNQAEEAQEEVEVFKEEEEEDTYSPRGRGPLTTRLFGHNYVYNIKLKREQV